jgi:hypothetical protein
VLENGAGRPADPHLDDVALLRPVAQQLVRRVTKQGHGRDARRPDGGAKEHVHLPATCLLSSARDARGPQEPRRAHVGAVEPLRHLLHRPHGVCTVARPLGGSSQELEARALRGHGAKRECRVLERQLVLAGPVEEAGPAVVRGPPPEAAERAKRHELVEIR